MSKQFTKHQEDFICEVCGYTVHGNGYTNHCPYCLSSKHVDINPGDRAAECGGVMYATGLEIKNGDFVITHTCSKCKHTRKNKVSDNDVQKALRALSSGNLKSYIAQIKKKD